MKGKERRYLHMATVVMVVGLALLAASCGGSDDSTVTTASDDSTQTTVATGETDTSASATGTSGNVAVKGLVDNPMTLTVEVLEGMNVVEITVDHPKLGRTDYRGVRFSELFAALAVQDSASAVNMAASDGYMVEIPVAELRASEDAMLTIGDDGTITVIIPGTESKNWVKDVVTIEFK
jgi:hypothetical protein